MRIYFTDFFEVSPDTLEEYGAFNISLINDLPLFIDPFLIFCGEKEEYQQLHHRIMDYLIFLRDQAQENPVLDPGMMKLYYTVIPCIRLAMNSHLLLKMGTKKGASLLLNKRKTPAISDRCSM